MAKKKNEGGAAKPKASKKGKGAPAAPASTEPVKVQPFTQQLACGLKREEVEERAQRAAHLLADRDAREARHSEERKAQKAEIERIENEIRSLSAEVREKLVYRDVKCERQFVYANGVVKDIRLDTGEVITERPMTDAEKQRDLFDDGKPEGGAGGAAGPTGDIDDEFGDDPGAGAAEGAEEPKPEKPAKAKKPKKPKGEPKPDEKPAEDAADEGDDAEDEDTAAQ